MERGEKREIKKEGAGKNKDSKKKEKEDVRKKQVQGAVFGPMASLSNTEQKHQQGSSEASARHLTVLLQNHPFDVETVQLHP